MKICSKCKVEKTNKEFCKKKETKDGLNSSCRECKAISSKRYYQRNKEKVKKASKLYHEKNREKILKYLKEYNRNPLNTERNKERRAKWFKANFEKQKIKNTKWRIDNIEKDRMYKRNCSRKRRALKFNTGSSVTTEQINKLIKDSDNICFWCDEDIKKMHLDHIYPLSKGGKDEINNLVVSCQPCNNKKFDKDPEVWLDEILELKIKGI